MQRSDNYEAIVELNSISQSSAFRAFLDGRRLYLQVEVNKFIRQQDLINAFGALSKMDDLDKMMKVMGENIETMKKENKHG